MSHVGNSKFEHEKFEISYITYLEFVINLPKLFPTQYGDNRSIINHVMQIKTASLIFRRNGNAYSSKDSSVEKKVLRKLEILKLRVRI